VEEEELICFAWQNQLLRPPLRTVEGRTLEVAYPGRRNADAGPDFSMARLRIDGLEWVGEVEVHWRASDWRRHGHADDPRYHRLVLHVVYEMDDHHLEGDRSVAVLALRDQLRPGLLEAYQKLRAGKLRSLACADHLASTPPMLQSAWLQRMAFERLADKARRVHQAAERHSGDWRQALLVLLGRALGGPVNGEAFERIGHATPRHLLEAGRSDPLQGEALLLGQAGLLAAPRDTYAAELAERYRLLRHKHHLTPLPLEALRYARLRPPAFPELRLAIWAAVWTQGADDLLHVLVTEATAEALGARFAPAATAYWQTHYRLGRPSEDRHAAGLGQAVRRNLVINLALPLRFAYAENARAPHGQTESLEMLQELPPENDRLIRRWTALGGLHRHAADSQAFHHLFRHYCKPLRCLRCSIGKHILQKE
jgi:hypothetical protein